MLKIFEYISWGLLLAFFGLVVALKQTQVGYGLWLIEKVAFIGCLAISVGTGMAGQYVLKPECHMLVTFRRFVPGIICSVVFVWEFIWVLNNLGT